MVALGLVLGDGALAGLRDEVREGVESVERRGRYEVGTGGGEGVAGGGLGIAEALGFGSYLGRDFKLAGAEIEQAEEVLGGVGGANAAGAAARTAARGFGPVGRGGKSLCRRTEPA